MNLQNPGVLLALLPLAGFIVLLYLLKIRRKDLTVPATFLWPSRTDEVRANTLFQRLRFSWLLVLQLVALIALAFALARPLTRQAGLSGRVTVFVLDASAGMGATDVAPTRFDEGLRLVRDAVRAASTGDRMALIEAGPVPRVVFPLSTDPARQVAALESCRRYDAAADVGEALRLAAAVVANQESAQIVLLSDGAFDPPQNFAPGKAAVVYRSLGQTAENLAIVALGSSVTTEGRLAYCGVRNFGAAPAGTTLTIYADGRVLDSAKLLAKPGETTGRTVPVPAGVKAIEARLNPPDALVADDYAVTVTDPNAALRVLLVTQGDPFLERALSLDPRVTLDRAQAVPDSEQGATGPASTYDIVVFDGIAEEPVRSRGVLTLGVAGGPSPVRANGTVKNPIAVSAENHPILDGVDLRNVFIDSAQKVTPKATARTLSESSQTSLLVVDEGKQRRAYLAFRVLDSDFPLQVGFPIFVANVLDFLAGKAAADVLAVPAGSTFNLPADAADRPSLVVPSGRSLALKVEDGQARVRDLDRVGRYELRLGKTTKTLFASLRNERESNIAPVPSLSLGGGTVKAVATPVRYADFWRPLLLLGLLVLGAEWWLFARRS
ncbi:MAG: BatA and WFA domain-containing protein [Fimbriimonadaceae bacterium]|nr:BatA and WFA domain-containing protein [Fimbriimonadaceae bacterium]